MKWGCSCLWDHSTACNISVSRNYIKRKFIFMFPEKNSFISMLNGSLLQAASWYWCDPTRQSGPLCSVCTQGEWVAGNIQWTILPIFCLQYRFDGKFWCCNSSNMPSDRCKISSMQSWHVQKLYTVVMISSLEFGWEQNYISIKFWVVMNLNWQAPHT